MARKLDWTAIIAVAALIIAAGLVIVVVTPSLRGAFTKPHEAQKTASYGLWKFTYQAPFWTTQYQQNGQVYNLNFRYLPTEVDNITVYGNSARLTSPFYLSFDPSMSNETKAIVRVAFTDASTKLKGLYGEQPLAACTQNDTDPQCAGYPSITCRSNVSAIVFTEDQQPSVSLLGDCIEISASGVDVYRAETLMWYRLLGIVK